MEVMVQLYQGMLVTIPLLNFSSLVKVKTVIMEQEVMEMAEAAEAAIRNVAETPVLVEVAEAAEAAAPAALAEKVVLEVVVLSDYTFIMTIVFYLMF